MPRRPRDEQEVRREVERLSTRADGTTNNLWSEVMVQGTGQYLPGGLDPPPESTEQFRRNMPQLANEAGAVNPIVTKLDPPSSVKFFETLRETRRQANAGRGMSASVLYEVTNTNDGPKTNLQQLQDMQKVYEGSVHENARTNRNSTNWPFNLTPQISQGLAQTQGNLYGATSQPRQETASQAAARARADALFDEMVGFQQGGPRPSSRFDAASLYRAPAVDQTDDSSSDKTITPVIARSQNQPAAPTPTPAMSRAQSRAQARAEAKEAKTASRAQAQARVAIPRGLGRGTHTYPAVPVRVPVPAASQAQTQAAIGAPVPMQARTAGNVPAFALPKAATGSQAESTTAVGAPIRPQARTATDVPEVPQTKTTTGTQAQNTTAIGTLGRQQAHTDTNVSTASKSQAATSSQAQTSAAVSATPARGHSRTQTSFKVATPKIVTGRAQASTQTGQAATPVGSAGNISAQDQIVTPARPYTGTPQQIQFGSLAPSTIRPRSQLQPSAPSFTPTRARVRFQTHPETTSQPAGTNETQTDKEADSINKKSLNYPAVQVSRDVRVASPPSMGEAHGHPGHLQAATENRGGPRTRMDLTRQPFVTPTTSHPFVNPMLAAPRTPELAGPLFSYHPLLPVVSEPPPTPTPTGMGRRRSDSYWSSLERGVNVASTNPLAHAYGTNAAFSVGSIPPHQQVHLDHAMSQAAIPYVGSSVLPSAPARAPPSPPGRSPPEPHFRRLEEAYRRALHRGFGPHSVAGAGASSAAPSSARPATPTPASQRGFFTVANPNERTGLSPVREEGPAGPGARVGVVRPRRLSGGMSALASEFVSSGEEKMSAFGAGDGRPVMPKRRR
ncbi:MAG: hypothetical protein MMC23_005242 [Stictis urceolatum]|nr:hypothetical protein [Stictis urceolata]